MVCEGLAHATTMLVLPGHRRLEPGIALVLPAYTKRMPVAADSCLKAALTSGLTPAGAYWVFSLQRTGWQGLNCTL